MVFLPQLNSLGVYQSGVDISRVKSQWSPVFNGREARKISSFEWDRQVSLTSLQTSTRVILNKTHTHNSADGHQRIVCFMMHLLMYLEYFRLKVSWNNKHWNIQPSTSEQKKSMVFLIALQQHRRSVTWSSRWRSRGTILQEGFHSHGGYPHDLGTPISVRSISQ